MTVEVADAHAHVQRLVSVFKMAILFEKSTTEKQRSVVCFLWAKGLNVNNIHKEIFPVYGGKYSVSFKAVHNLVEKVADDVRPGAELTDTAIKRFLCCGFGSTGTRVSMLVEDMSRNKCLY
jgi:hypothetical protein